MGREGLSVLLALLGLAMLARSRNIPVYASWCPAAYGYDRFEDALPYPLGAPFPHDTLCPLEEDARWSGIFWVPMRDTGAAQLGHFDAAHEFIADRYDFSRRTAGSRALQVSVLHNVGCVVRGLDLHVSPATVTRELTVALTHHTGFVLMRDQNLTRSEHTAFLHWFAEHLVPQHTHAADTFHPSKNEAGYLSNRAGNGLANVGISGWHVDFTWADSPYGYISLQCMAIGAYGDTRFAHGGRVLEHIEAKYEGVGAYFDALTNYQLWSRIEHPLAEAATCPLVMYHRLSGRRTLMTHLGTPVKGGGFRVDRTGVPAENRKSLDEDAAWRVRHAIQDAAEHEDNQYVHHWRVGDLIVWDNWALLHMADPSAAYPEDIVGLRRMQRVCTSLPFAGKEPFAVRHLAS